MNDDQGFLQNESFRTAFESSNSRYPFKFHTSHPYRAQSEKLIEQATAWIKQNNLKIRSNGYIRVGGYYPGYGDFPNILWWESDTEETAIYFKLIWEMNNNDI